MWKLPVRVLRVIFLIVLILTGFAGLAQRSYRDHSVLASGNWYRIGITAPGVYRIDPGFLSTLGLPAGSVSSASIRLFGNGGAMLPESNAEVPPDDLLENPIQVFDGGDGIFNGSDYFLFYAPGPDTWIKDSLNQRFRHRKNLYSDTSYYFISIGGNGLRIPSLTPAGTPSLSVSNYQFRYYHERDSLNLLSSGKEWFGEEFSDAPGRSLNRSFSLPGPFVSGETLHLTTAAAARSIGTSARFDIRWNDQLMAQMNFPATTAGAYDQFAREELLRISAPVTNPQINLSYTFVPGSFNSQAWLNWFELIHRRPLTLSNTTQVSFRDWLTVGNSLVEYLIANATNSTRVWDITEPGQPVEIQGLFNNNQFRFLAEGNRLREFIAFTGFLNPIPLGPVANQDLHGLPVSDYIILVHPLLKAQAERLAQYHRQRNNLQPLVVTTTEVYNEFASGSPDPAAIRNFVKMQYDRARLAGQPVPRYLLLFGDASFDYKDRITGNTNLVPAYQNDFALDPLDTYTSDDFFGFLDDNEDINSQLVIPLLDIGIGRIPAKNGVEAGYYVDKLIAYHNRESYGPWRNRLTLIADDEDQNLHIEDAELFATTASATNSLVDIEKVYLDAYPQETVDGAERYPAVNEFLRNRIIDGTLIWNYNGHGSYRRLAEEVVLDAAQIAGWNNPQRLPLFITATCDFAPYDNPLLPSLGEDILLRPKTGGIALMTTTRLVFAFSNRVMNNNYLRFALAPLPDGRYRSLGEAIREAKNFTYQNSTDIVNNRKFTLLGDPALVLGFPTLDVNAIRINGVDINQADTLRALEKIKIDGTVTDQVGNIRNDFNGTAYTTIYDKPRQTQTLGNDPGSPVRDFQVQDNIIYRGRSTVQNGRFVVEFKVPRDLDPRIGNGRMSFYAENGSEEAGGAFTDFLTGGIATDLDNDREGPEIRAWLNDEKFVNGGIANTNPILVLRFADSSGINTIRSGIGHDIVVTIDNDKDNFIILNDFYEADADTYQSGGLRFQLPAFEPGPHSLRIKAWDVANNSNEIVLDFEVVNDGEIILSRVLNYPNPFTTRTQFWFEHNQPGEDLRVDIQVFTISGKIIKRISETINTPGNRSSEVEWDGRDDFGARIGRGVYLYKLRVSNAQLKSKTFIGKLVVF